MVDLWCRKDFFHVLLVSQPTLVTLMTLNEQLMYIKL